jgi:hypothetical protein
MKDKLNKSAKVWVSSFNCMLPAFSCRQFATCNEFTGRCECPEGFGGDDCAEPGKDINTMCIVPLLTVCFIVCGGLDDGRNRPIRNGTSCDCTSGWDGINCNSMFTIILLKG